MAEGFLSRWARLKRERDAGEGEPLAEPPAALPADPRAAAPAPVGGGKEGEAAGEPTRTDADGDAATGTETPRGPGAPPPELPPVDSLTPDSDFTPYLRQGVSPATRNAALKKLFADPAFNVMDGLDVYIDDYGKTEPIPSQMLGQLLDEHATKLADRLLGATSPGNEVAAVAAERGGDAHEPVQLPDEEPASTIAEVDSAMATRIVDDESTPATGAQPASSQSDDPAVDADPCSGLHRR